VNLEEYRTVFTVTSLLLTLIVAAPMISMLIPIRTRTERFSELWILGPDHTAGDHPFNVRVNETHRIFAGLGNHMGYPAYYMVLVKFRNRTQPLPDSLSSKPSPLPPIYEFRAFVSDGARWEAPLNFAFLEVSRSEDSFLVRQMSINGVVFSVNCTSDWDSENGGFYYQLFLELYLCDTSLHEFRYENRFVGIWLNATE